MSAGEDCGMVYPTITGGTWAREAALQAAASAMAGWFSRDENTNTAGGVQFLLSTAEEFEAWLNRPDPTAPKPQLVDIDGVLGTAHLHADDLGQVPSFNEMTEQLARLRDLGMTRGAMLLPVNMVWPPDDEPTRTVVERGVARLRHLVAEMEWAAHEHPRTRLTEGIDIRPVREVITYLEDD